MFKSIFTNSFGILASRIMGFIRDLLTASILGANIYSDIFFVAFKLPNLFRRIFAEGAFSQSFLPSFTATKIKSVFAFKVFIFFFTALVTLTIIVNLFSYEITKIIALGFSDEIIAIAAPLVAINFYYLILIFSVTFLSALLHYKEHFATTAFSTVLLNLALIIALLTARHESKEIIIYYLSWGVVAGGLLQLLAHIAAVKGVGLCKLIVGGALYSRKKSMHIAGEIRRFQGKFIPAIWGNSTAQVSAFLDTWLASFLISGSISYLYYANRIFQLPLALFAIATSIALFPKIAKAINSGNEVKVQYLLKKSFWFLMFLLSYSLLGGVILSKEIIVLLFERGAFTHSDSIESAKILTMYMIGLIPYGIARLFSLYLYATHQLSKSAQIATYTLAVNVALSLILVSKMGAVGLALSGSISGFVLLYLTIKAFGLKNFLAIIADIKALWLLLSLPIATAIIFGLKELFYVYF